jgi:hypothetical protein
MDSLDATSSLRSHSDDGVGSSHDRKGRSRFWHRASAAERVRVSNIDHASIPHSPGVYVWFRDGQPVYVGMATDLRDRLNRHLGTDLDLSRSAFRRNVLEHLGKGTVADARVRPSVLTSDQVEPVNIWIAACEVAWLACESVEEADGLENALLLEQKPPLNRRKGKAVPR